MSSTSSCCASLLNQHQQQAAHHLQNCKDLTSAQNSAQTSAQTPEQSDSQQSRNCTVVENGRVVVKPRPQPEAITPPRLGD
ncbi:MAG TPA: hypothetical protein V6D18_16585 [Thermosynechococcaceae cyanobacterium]